MTNEQLVSLIFKLLAVLAGLVTAIGGLVLLLRKLGTSRPSAQTSASKALIQSNIEIMGSLKEIGEGLQNALSGIRELKDRSCVFYSGRFPKHVENSLKLLLQEIVREQQEQARRRAEDEPRRRGEG